MPPEHRSSRSIIRCDWVPDKPDYIRYHDTEWGVPIHDDQVLFEFLILEGAQAGLSWDTVLKKREHYRQVLDQFHVSKIAAYDTDKLNALLADPGLIRNRLKIHSLPQNAKAFLKVQEEFGSFDTYLWRFTEGKTLVNHRQTIKEIPATSPESDAMSKDLKKRGFNFVGSTICYAYMQAIGMVNDHIVNCYRFQELNP